MYIYINVYIIFIYSMYVDMIYSRYIIYLYMYSIYIRIDESNEVNRGGEKNSPTRWVLYGISSRLP